MKMAETSSSGPNRARAIGFGPFEYSAQTARIHYLAKNYSTKRSKTLFLVEISLTNKTMKMTNLTKKPSF
jgi:hypothetical protein